MTRLAQNPLVLALPGLVAGLVAGLFWFWRAGDVLVAHARVAVAAAPVEAQRALGWDFWTIEMENLARDLKQEKTRLTFQSEQLEVRASRLAAERDELAKTRTELEVLRAELEARVTSIGADEARNLRTLAQTYTGLTPKAAVAIIREMNDATAVKILSLMKPDSVAPIFEEMSKSAGSDGALARRVAELSDKLRLMKAGKPSNS